MICDELVLPYMVFGSAGGVCYCITSMYCILRFFVGKERTMSGRENEYKIYYSVGTV